MSTTHTRSQHAPGPWTIEFPRIAGDFPTLSDGTPYVEISGGCGYAGGRNPGFQITGYMDEESASLISAAPDLIDCLIHLVDSDWFGDGEAGQVVCSLDAGKVRAALLKALNISPPAPVMTPPDETQSTDMHQDKNGTRVGILPDAGKEGA